MRKAVRLHINGLLQSMFYRQFIKQHADQYAVFGFLRKLESGIIEIFIQGETSAVDAMVAVCKRGPKYAKVYEVKEKEERWQDDIKDFKIMNF